MKKSFIYFSALAIVIMLSGNAYSQNSFSLHAGPSFPLADFGDDDLNDEDAGCAGVGLSLGGNYVFQLNDKGLGLYLGADFDINGLKSSVKDDIEDNLASGVDIEFYKFINVPVIAGLNYSFKGNDQIALFGNAGIGPDILKVTDMTMKQGSNKVEISYETSAKLAYSIGGGLILDDKIILGVNYYGLGEHNLKGEAKYSGYTDTLDDQKLKVSLMTVTIGIKI